jgi:hypothetical protein
MGRQDLLQAGRSTGAVTPSNRLSLQQDGSSPMSALPAPMIYAWPVQRANDAQPGWAATPCDARASAPLGQVLPSVQPHPEIRTDSEPLQRLGSNAKDAKSDSNFRT